MVQLKGKYPKIKVINYLTLAPFLNVKFLDASFAHSASFKITFSKLFIGGRKHLVDRKGQHC